MVPILTQTWNCKNVAHAQTAIGVYWSKIMKVLPQCSFWSHCFTMPFWTNAPYFCKYTGENQTYLFLNNFSFLIGDSSYLVRSRNQYLLLIGGYVIFARHWSLIGRFAVLARHWSLIGGYAAIVQHRLPWAPQKILRLCQGRNWTSRAGSKPEILCFEWSK